MMTMRNLLVSLIVTLSSWSPGFAQTQDRELRAPEDGGPRYFRVDKVSNYLNLRENPSITARVSGRLSSGAILDNLGCQEAEGRIWCDVQTFGGGPRGFVSADFVSPAPDQYGAVLYGPNDSAFRAGQGEFDATGQLPCAQAPGQPMRQCEFGVARAGGGDATVVVKTTGERTRALFFARGQFVSADTSQADGYPELRSGREADLSLIRVGEERYEVPDAVIFGG